MSIRYVKNGGFPNVSLKYVENMFYKVTLGFLVPTVSPNVRLFPFPEKKYESKAEMRWKSVKVT